MSNRSSRLEWISLVYLVFFVLAVLAPSIYTHAIGPFSESTLEELTIFVFGVAGIVTFTIYERTMEKREKESEQVQMDYSRAKAELLESYTYIGSINRQIELLKKLANETSLSLANSKKMPRELFQALAANACSAAGAQCALLRFVENDRLRTEREFTHDAQAHFVFRVPNRDLRGLHERSELHAVLHTEDGKDVLVIPSDRPSEPHQAYLLLHMASQSIQEIDVSLLKVFVNQAQMLYHNFVNVGVAPTEQPTVPLLVESPPSK